MPSTAAGSIPKVDAQHLYKRHVLRPTCARVELITVPAPTMYPPAISSSVDTESEKGVLIPKAWQTKGFSSPHSSSYHRASPWSAARFLEPWMATQCSPAWPKKSKAACEVGKAAYEDSQTASSGMDGLYISEEVG